MQRRPTGLELGRRWGGRGRARRGLVVSDGVSLPADGRSGRAVDVSLGAEATFTRARIERNREIAIAAWEPGTRITMTDVRVLDTLERTCATDACAGFGQGVSLGAYRGAEIAAESFEIAGSALAGIQIARDGAIDLTGGTVSGHPIAVNIQVPEYDVSRLTHGVVYRDNDVQLDAAALPLPDDPLTGE